MDKNIVRKPKSKDKSIINWSVVSKLLTGNSANIRQNRIPKKHLDKVNRLLHYVDSWKQDKILISTDEFKEKIKNLDLLSVIMDEK